MHATVDIPNQSLNAVLGGDSIELVKGYRSAMNWEITTPVPNSRFKPVTKKEIFGDLLKKSKSVNTCVNQPLHPQFSL